MRRFLIVAMLLIALAFTACSSEAGSEEVNADVSSLRAEVSSLGEQVAELEAQVVPLSDRIDILETRLLQARRTEEDLSQRLEQQRQALADYESRTNGVINRLRTDLEGLGENVTTLEEELKQHVEDRARFYYDLVVNNLCPVLPPDIQASVCRQEGSWWRLRE